MTTMLVEAEIYVEDTGLSKALVIEGDDVYTSMFLGKTESYEIADRLEAFVSENHTVAEYHAEEATSLSSWKTAWIR